ncbi:hypothetical protein ACGFX4_23380 [Kitasatospora sp. NPDC048365]|uniref:hypothetical protein n=1 Tax=Kitasatospora sp. NPDC048365 TaxID=3364050 RepID=UPI00371A5547
MITRGKRMTKRQRRQVAWSLRGVALLAVLAHLPGARAATDGGLVRVESWLNRPVLLLGGAIALIVLSLVVELDFRTKWSQIGCAALLAPLVLVGALVVFVALTKSGGAHPMERLTSPAQPDRVVTVIDLDFIDPVYRFELRTGTGWSERHWDLGEYDGFEHDEHAEWTGPNEITVTREDSRTVFTLDPATGRPDKGREVPR